MQRREGTVLGDPLKVDDEGFGRGRDRREGDRVGVVGQNLGQASEVVEGGDLTNHLKQPVFGNLARGRGRQLRDQTQGCRIQPDHQSTGEGIAHVRGHVASLRSFERLILTRALLGGLP